MCIRDRTLNARILPVRARTLLTRPANREGQGTGFFSRGRELCYSCPALPCPLLVFLAAAALLSASLPAAAQQFQPKTIQFKGDPEYSCLLYTSICCKLNRIKTGM